MGCFKEGNVKFIAGEEVCEFTNVMSNCQVIKNNNSTNSDNKKTIILMTLRKLYL